MPIQFALAFSFYTFSPGEWFLDSTDSSNWTLYFWHVESKSPATSRVEVKVHDYCYNVSDSQNVHLENIDFVACTFQLLDCNESTINGLNLVYPTFNREILETGPVDAVSDHDKEDVSNFGEVGIEANEEGRTAARMSYWLRSNGSGKQTAATHIQVSTTELND